MMKRPGRPASGLPGDRSRIVFVVGIFRAATFGLDLPGDHFGEKLAKTLHFCRETRPVRRVGIDAIQFGFAVLVFGREVVVWVLGHWIWVWEGIKKPATCPGAALGPVGTPPAGNLCRRGNAPVGSIGTGPLRHGLAK